MDRVEAAYLDIPPITRAWGTITSGVSLACALGLLSPYHLYFDASVISHRREYWRLFSSYFYFGSFGIDFIFHMFFLTRYARLLEEGSFRTRRADFLYMLLLCGAQILAIAFFLPTNHMPFLGGPLTFVMVYVWSRRNPFVRMNFLGVLNFDAPFLPWVLIAFATLLHGIPVADLVGMIVGHLYWYLEDIYPRMLDANGRPRGKFLKTPRLLMDLCGQHPPEVVVADLTQQPQVRQHENLQDPRAGEPLQETRHVDQPAEQEMRPVAEPHTDRFEQARGSTNGDSYVVADQVNSEAHEPSRKQWESDTGTSSGFHSSMTAAAEDSSESSGIRQRRQGLDVDSTQASSEAEKPSLDPSSQYDSSGTLSSPSPSSSKAASSERSGNYWNSLGSGNRL